MKNGADPWDADLLAIVDRYPAPRHSPHRPRVHATPASPARAYELAHQPASASFEPTKLRLIPCDRHDRALVVYPGWPLPVPFDKLQVGAPAVVGRPQGYAVAVYKGYRDGFERYEAAGTVYRRTEEMPFFRIAYRWRLAALRLLGYWFETIAALDTALAEEKEA